MKESFGEKLKRARTQSGLKQSELAKTLGVKNTTISNWENNISKPDLDMLSYICGVLNVKASFFLEAHPPIEDVDCSEYEIIKKYRFIAIHSPDGASVVDTVLDREYTIATQLKEQSEYIKHLETAEVDMRLINYYYRVASAGTGQIIFDMPPTKRIEIPNTPKYRKVDYAIGVNGNSMEPLYQDGDILLVEMRDDVEIGEVGIFRVNGESYVKKLGETELISLNPASKNIPLNESAGCMGKVIDKLPKD